MTEYKKSYGSQTIFFGRSNLWLLFFFVGFVFVLEMSRFFFFLSFFLVHLPPEHFYWFVQFVIYDPQGLFFVTYMYFYIEMRETRDDAKNFLTRVFSREKRVTSSRVFRDLNFKNP